LHLPSAIFENALATGKQSNRVATSTSPETRRKFGNPTEWCFKACDELVEESRWKSRIMIESGPTRWQTEHSINNLIALGAGWGGGDDLDSRPERHGVREPYLNANSGG
jgi:hypothetical protein